MRRVIIESPFAGKVISNIHYARDVMHHCLTLGEAPIAFHIMYPQALDDTNKLERALGFKASQSWYAQAEAVVVYEDKGITPGMKAGITMAEKLGIPVEYRTLYDEAE